jgi:hypothetical protein
MCIILYTAEVSLIPNKKADLRWCVSVGVAVCVPGGC